ncbi:MAG: NAD(P)H-dependent oxidoreductase [Deferrisomatales bacterium]
MGALSFSEQLCRAFLEAYLDAHPGDQVDTVNVWGAELPAFDFVAASGKYKVLRGLEHTPEEAAAWAKVVRVTERFKAADKVVVSTGMWNFSIPYRLKQFLDVIVQPGLTFAFDPATGYSGLVTGKPLQLLLASGGEYPPGTEMAGLDFQRPYLEAIFRFIGFADVRVLRVEGTLSEQAQSNLEAARQAAREAARTF